MPFLVFTENQFVNYKNTDNLSGFEHWVSICPVKIPNFTNFLILDALTVFSL